MVVLLLALVLGDFLQQYFALTTRFEGPGPGMGGADLTGEGTGLEDPPPGDEPLGADGLPEGEPEPVIVPEESVAAMHEGEDLGFGEIVKLMGIVEGSRDENGENCSLTIDTLLAEYEEGAQAWVSYLHSTENWNT